MTERVDVPSNRSMTWQGVGKSEIGLIRPTNQDRLAVLDAYQFWIVADGMGGHPAGDLAASIAVETVAREAARRLGQRGPCAQDRTLDLIEWFKIADRAIKDRSIAEPALTGMGTTIVALLITPTPSPVAHVAHLGDSRAYLYRKGLLTQLTRDHTLVEQYLASGLIDATEAKTHPKRHVLIKALGMDDEPSPSSSSVALEPDDVLILCTDGLNKMLQDDEISKVLSSTPGDPLKACHDLVKESLARGGDDNVTIVICTAS